MTTEIDDAAYLVALEQRSRAASAAAQRKRADVYAYSHATPERRAVLRETNHGKLSLAAQLKGRTVVHERNRLRKLQETKAAQS